MGIPPGRGFWICFLHLQILLFGGVVGMAVAGSGSTGLAPKGEGEIVVGQGAGAMRVFTYKPKNFSSGPILFVFHGMKRNAESYRDYAIPLAEKMRAMVAAPYFDNEAYPSLAYAHGNLRRGDGGLRPQSEWSFTAATEMIRTVLAREGNPRRPYFLIGHSAGGQFVLRLAAVKGLDARRIVAANAGTYAFPRADWDWPYGLGRLPAEFRREENLRRFLAAPLTVYLGQADTHTTVEAGTFDDSPEANREGSNRLERGRNFFEFGQKLAGEKKWAFGWKKTEVPGIGHEGKLMINNLAMEEALDLKNKAP